MRMQVNQLVQITIIIASNTNDTLPRATSLQIWTFSYCPEDAGR